MASKIVRELNREEIEDLKERSNAIAESAPPGIVSDNTFIFWVGFDGTYNTKDDPAFSHDKYSTAVGSLHDQIEKASEGSNNIKAKYYPGPGTPGTLLGSAMNPTDQARVDAEKAYNEFAEQAYNWKENNPDGEIKVMIASFSRGAVPAAIFSQMLDAKGLVYTDPVTGEEKELVPPGKIGISAGLVISPVTTGAQGNLIFPPSSNVEVILARDEQRVMYTQNRYPGLGEHVVAGDHSDVGCSQDNGIGGILLEDYTRYFAKTGIPIETIPQNRKNQKNDRVFIHEQTFDTGFQTIPNAFRRSQGSALITDMPGQPHETQCDSDELCITTYENYEGNKISYAERQGVRESTTITTDTRVTQPDGSVRWKLGEPITKYQDNPPKELAAEPEEIMDDSNDEYYYQYDYPGR